MNVIKPRDSSFIRQFETPELRPYAWVPEFQTFLRRRWATVAGSLVACMVLGVASLVFVPPKFTATAQLLIDSRRADPFHEQTTTPDSQAINGLVESEVEVLRSDGLARKVVQRLNLADDPAFLALGHTLTKTITAPFQVWLARLQGNRSAVPDDKVQRAARILTNLTSVRRIGLTYVIDVGVRAPDPQMAANLTNGITAAYIAAQLEAKYDATHEASEWLQKRIADLRQQALAADHAVQDYKVRYNIVDTDKGLLNEQELAELNSELVAAHTRTAAAAARHVADPYRNDLQMAQASEQNIHRRINQLIRETAATNSQRVVLRALESSADTYRALYENFLQRYTQAVQEQSFPVSEARVVTAAVPPLTKSFPQPLLVLPLSGIAGLGLGFMFAFLRDSSERGLRTASQLRAVTGLDCVGLLPRLRGRDLRKRIARREPTGLRTVPRALSTDSPALRYVLEHPQSQFASAIGSICVRLSRLRSLARDVKIVGCVAARPGEGTSTVAANLAQFLARSGQRTILVDGNPGASSLTQTLASEPVGGLPDLLAGRAQLEDVVWRDRQTDLHFLPVGYGPHVPTMMEMLSSIHMETLLAELRADYDHVVIDLPALSPVADAQGAGHLIDAFVLVVGWGTTSQDVLAENLSRADLDGPRPLGAVLNRVNLRAMRSLWRRT